jgi:hypothetical protein
MAGRATWKRYIHFGSVDVPVKLHTAVKEERIQFELIYIGHSGGGFGAKNLKEILERLQPLIQKECPFKIKPATNTPVTG